MRDRSPYGRCYVGDGKDDEGRQPDHYDDLLKP